MTQGRKASTLPYGNGCKVYPDCFTCPGPPHCVSQYGANIKDQSKTVRKWKPYFERELSRLALGGKG